ncbi:hypothetical protein WMY93_006208 [Mugilogobius chulae]|uniref:Uncharacterized protein n=1 Tax=Mugilogobius chulae TaxID=88201 RepID=A0AAW0PJ24_9GOBI
MCVGTGWSGKDHGGFSPNVVCPVATGSKDQLSQGGSLVPGIRLKRSLKQYFSDTFSCIHTMADFISKRSEWIKKREEEAKEMRIEGLSKYKDEAALRKGLEPTLEGLKEMENFLEAMEKLAVTSVQVFEENQVVQLSEDTDLESVRGL